MTLHPRLVSDEKKKEDRAGGEHVCLLSRSSSMKDVSRSFSFSAWCYVERKASADVQRPLSDTSGHAAAPSRLSLWECPSFFVCFFVGLLPPPEMDFEAASYLDDLTQNLVFQCKVEKIDTQKKRHCILTPQEEVGLSSKKPQTGRGKEKKEKERGRATSGWS